MRFRACQTVSKLLNALDEGAEVDDEMWELLQTTMLKRTTDKIPIVRVQAINALVRLQDPSDVDCPVINAFLQRMECDSSPGKPKALMKPEGKVPDAKLCLLMVFNPAQMCARLRWLWLRFPKPLLLASLHAGATSKTLCGAVSMK